LRTGYPGLLIQSFSPPPDGRCGAVRCGAVAKQL
jgi:hypothetical protein